MKKRMNISGFSMVEVLVAAAALAGLAVVATQLSTSSNKQIKTVETKAARTDFKNQILSSLAEGTACTMSLAGNNILTAGTAVTTLKDTLGNTIYKADPTTGTKDAERLWQITSMKLGAFTATTSATQGTVDLLVTLHNLKFTKGTAYGPEYTTITYPLTTTVTTGRGSATISTCNPQQSSGGSDKWITNSDGIYYNDQEVTIGAPSSPMGAMLDINGTIGPLWANSTTLYKGIELDPNNLVAWKNGAADFWGVGYVNDGGANNYFGFSHYNTGRPAGVITRLKFDNSTGDISLAAKSNSNATTPTGTIDMYGLIKTTWCTYAPSICNASMPTYVFGSGDFYSGGIGFNALPQPNGGGIALAANNTGPLLGNGGGLILSDWDTNATMRFYSFASTSSTAAQTIIEANRPFAEKLSIDSYGNVALGGNGTTGNQYSQATGNPGYILGSGYTTGGRGSIFSAQASAPYAVSLGRASVAAGDSAIAGGYRSRAYGMYNVALGYQAEAGQSGSPNDATNGVSAVAIGNSLFSTGIASMAIGYGSTVNGNYATAIGNFTNTSGFGAMTLSDNSTTSTVTNHTTNNALQARFDGGYSFFTDPILSSNVGVFISSIGRLGVGTNAPVLKAVVESNSTNDGIMIRQTGTTAAALRLTQVGGSGHDWAIFSTGSGNAQGAGKLQFYDYSGVGETITIDGTNGRVGMFNNAPAYNLDVSGTIRATSTVTGSAWITSDQKFKKNISLIKSPVEKILAIEGVTYDWRVNDYPEKKFSEEKQYGVIAQQVEKVVPEIVHQTVEGYKTVEYNKIVPILVEAFKSLYKKVENLVMGEKAQELELAKLKAHNLALERELDKVKQDQAEMRQVLCVQKKYSFCK